ncbi:MAG: tripartite tricarboxylate transporter substrate binding protein [Betaproteobacteria bacterium]|nr:tripartite tricarboxylate transporter substrate binding protein [Betaproteobacteria bacterium]
MNHESRFTLRRLSLLFGAALLAAAGSAIAQGYPAKPVRLIVPFAAGGNADIIARLIAQKLGETLKQSFVVDNRGGANGIIGSDIAAKSPPDGYTLLFVASGHAINPGLHSKLPFDPVRDFAPVALVSSTPLTLAVTRTLPAKSVKELLSLARGQPGVMSYASQGNGSPGHLAGALLNKLGKVKIVHVPYKATAQALTDLTSGQVQVMYPSFSAVLPHVKAGRVRALAITSRNRSKLAPELPTMTESGITGYEAAIWNGVLAPAGTPPAAVTRLHDALAAAVRSAETRDRIVRAGADPAVGTPEEFSRHIASEISKWGKLISETGVRID